VIGLAAISTIAYAKDLFTARAHLPPVTFATSAQSDEWKIENALSAELRGINQDLSNNEPYVTLLCSTVGSTPLWIIPVAKGGEKINEEKPNVANTKA
jgi:hypothetical protein